MTTNDPGVVWETPPADKQFLAWIAERGLVETILDHPAGYLTALNERWFEYLKDRDGDNA